MQSGAPEDYARSTPCAQGLSCARQKADRNRPEFEQQLVQWVDPGKALSMIKEPELKKLVSTFARRAVAAASRDDSVGPGLMAPVIPNHPLPPSSTIRLERAVVGSNWSWDFPNQRDFDSTCWLGGGQQEMAKPYSQDLRDRVIDAVKKGEMSRRAAARRYEISRSRGDQMA